MDDIKGLIFRKERDFAYLGSVNLSEKHKKGYKYGSLNYSLYLAPANMSGYEVCPGRTAECTALCLNHSGKNIGAMRDGAIDKSRIKKTIFFMEDRQFFMEWMCAEIILAKIKADKLGYVFNVRLNNTSDISPESFRMTIGGTEINILERFPDIQFYDYTKVPTRYILANKYPNYNLTFSYTGLNKDECLRMLDRGINVAVVFKKKLPETFWDRPVIDGDVNDLRHKDKKGVIVGLKFKTVRERPKEDSKFVIDPAL
jgi:hypothetical protein